GNELGALLEERVAPVGFEFEVVPGCCSERLVALRAKILFGEGCRKTQLRLSLRARNSGQAHANNRRATGHDCTAIDRSHVCFLPRSREFWARPRRWACCHANASGPIKCTN